MPAKLDYKNPAATASMVVVREKSNLFSREHIYEAYEILLIKRKHEPYAGMWALPGGFLNCDKESLEVAAVREFGEETPFVAKIENLELLCVHSEPDRDPRGHVIDHVYIVKEYQEQPHEDGDYDDAAEVKFFSYNNLPQLAFDHKKAIEKYRLWRQKYGK